jgi:hypothetical protein
MNARAAFDVERCYRRAWDAFQRQPLGLLLGAFLLWITNGGGGGGNSIPDLGQGVDSSSDSSGDSPEAALRQLFDMIGGVELAVIGGVLACVLIVVGLVLLFRAWLLPGYLRLQRACLLGEEAGVGILFGGGDALVRMIGWQLLRGVIGMGTFVVSALPAAAIVVLSMGADDSQLRMIGLGTATAVGVLTIVPASVYVGLGLVLGDHYVALGNTDVMDALDRSWDAASGNRLTILGFLVLTWLPNLLGCLACCIGMVFTQCLQSMSLTEAWLVLTGAVVPGARDDAGQAETGGAGA